MSKIIEYTRSHPVGFTLSLIGILAATVFVVITYITLTYNGKVKVTLSLAPNDAKVAIDGKEVGARTVYLDPKKYTFTATKDGYESYSKEVYLEKDQGEVSIALSLRALTDVAKKDQQKNMEDYLENEGIAGKQANADGVRFRQKNPIVEHLPYKTMLYTIGYRADNSDPTGMSIIIEIDTTEGSRSDVVAQIARWGYDPTRLNIQFRNYRNPFDEN